MYELIREDVVIKLGARVDGKGEGEHIGGGDAAGHGGSGDGERGCRGGGCDSGEKGFGSSVKEIRFFLFFLPSFLSAVIARVFGAIVSLNASQRNVHPCVAERTLCRNTSTPSQNNKFTNAPGEEIFSE